jgi:glycerol kinase
MLFNLHDLKWDEEIIELLGLKGIQLPQPFPSSHLFGATDFNCLLPIPIPVTGMIGDSHAAAFGEGCFEPGIAKATMGTGCSVLMNTGNTLVESKHGMIATICWSIEGRVDYALEGVIVSCGSTIEWLKNELNLFKESRDAEAMATSVADNNGVYLVPAFSGLGAPHWQMKSRAVISGLSFDCNKNHIVRAALESIPYQIKDVLDAMEQDGSIPLKELNTDGGITVNTFVMQFLTDLLNRPVARIGMPDVSALGAAYMAGLKAGVYPAIDYLQKLNTEKQYTTPSPATSTVDNFYNGWKAAVASVRKQ